MRSFALQVLVFLPAALAAGAGRAGAVELLRADPAASALAIHVAKSGVLSGVSHEHHFVPQSWQAEARFDPARPAATEVWVVVDAGSLHDREGRLNAASRAEVDRKAAGAEVLDARRFPEVRFRGAEVKDLRVPGPGALEGVLRGELALHGVHRPVEVPFRARVERGGFRVTGSARFLQSDFGIRPYSTALGTIGVDDLVSVEFDLVLAPASSPRVAGQGARPQGS